MQSVILVFDLWFCGVSLLNHLSVCYDREIDGDPNSHLDNF